MKWQEIENAWRVGVSLDRKYYQLHGIFKDEKEKKKPWMVAAYRISENAITFWTTAKPSAKNEKKRRKRLTEAEQAALQAEIFNRYKNKPDERIVIVTSESR